MRDKSGWKYKKSGGGCQLVACDTPLVHCQLPVGKSETLTCYEIIINSPPVMEDLVLRQTTDNRPRTDINANGEAQ